MNTEQKFRLYDRIIAVILGLIILSALFLSCTPSRHSRGYQDHLRSTPTDNWVRNDNGGCGWVN